MPTDLIDEETWRHITLLPDDVSIRTSNHHGKLIRELNELNNIWVEHAVGDVEDILHKVLIYMMDEFQMRIILMHLLATTGNPLVALRNLYAELVVYEKLLADLPAM